MQVLKGFLLGPLGLAQLLDEVRFNILELLYFFLHFSNLLLSLLLVEIIILRDLVVHLGLVQLLEGNELLLMLQTGTHRVLRSKVVTYSVYHGSVLPFLLEGILFLHNPFVVSLSLFHCHEFFRFLNLET